MTNPARRDPTPELTGSWGLLGGAFDPVHRGHLALARDMQKAKTLVGVLFVPSFSHPQKGTASEAPFEDRLAMVKLAIREDLAFLISDIESEMARPNYSVDTVRELKKRHPGANFLFIIGADLLFQLETWHQPDELLREVPILAGSRPMNDRMSESSAYQSDRIEIVETSHLKISSTAIRQRVRSGANFEELRDWVGAPVADYILSRRLYE